MSQDRKKASELFQERQYAFARKVPFEEAFTEIDDVVVEVEEKGYGVHAGFDKSRYTKESIGEYIDCSNPLCYNGGFSIGRILHEMVGKKQTDLDTFAICQGYEGSPKGKRRYRSCINSFKVKVHITYKAQPDQQNKGESQSSDQMHLS